jgi:hypothetical protein
MGAAAETGSGREDRLEWWFLDTLVVEHERAAGMESVVLEMTLPVGHAPAGFRCRVASPTPSGSFVIARLGS